MCSKVIIIVSFILNNLKFYQINIKTNVYPGPAYTRMRTSSFFLFFFFPAVPSGMRDLSSPTRDQTHAPCSGSAES